MGAALRRVLILNACIASACVAASAPAAPSARLVYVRDADAQSCPDETALRSAVAARLGYDPFLLHARSTMFAAIRRERSGYTAAIKLIDENNIVRGARELRHTGEQCAELVDLMALSMSIAIDPLSLARPRSPPEAAPPSQPAEPASAAPQTALTEPAVATRADGEIREPGPLEQLHLDLGLGPALAVGSAPAPALGARLAGGLHRGRLGAFAELRGDLPASREIGRATVRTSVVGGSLGACYEAGVVFGCVVGSVGALSAAGAGVSEPRTSRAIYGSLGVRVGAELRLTAALALRVFVDGAGVLTPHRLSIDGVDVETLSTVTALVGTTIVVRFF